MLPKVNKGSETEELVEKICTNMFFSDFTVRNPKYKKGGKAEKEAADILIPFEDKLIAIQVKSKAESKKVNEKTDLDFQRIKKVIGEGIEQLKTIKRALGNNWIVELTTVRGYKIPFDCRSIKKIIGMVIFDLIGEEVFMDEERTSIINGFDYKHDMPVHIFRRSDFEAISSEIDTLPDFLEYLKIREEFFKRGLFRAPIYELDFLALYKTKPDILERAIGSNSHILIEEGTWKYYKKTLRKTIKRRDFLKQPSYLIDIAINELHSSVGFDHRENILSSIQLTVPPGSLESYLAICYELARIPRLQRRLIGERFIRCLKQANQEIGFGYSFVALDELGERGVLVLSTKSGRTERTKMLYNLCAMVYCALELKQVVGIVTEPLTGYGRSFDFIILRDIEFDNCDELIALFEKTFGKRHTATFAEYIETEESK